MIIFNIAVNKPGMPKGGVILPVDHTSPMTLIMTARLHLVAAEVAQVGGASTPHHGLYSKKFGQLL